MATPERIPWRSAWTAVPIVWLVVVLVAHARHVFWQDEAQAWLIARAASTPLDLLAALRFEGHPLLWYLVLWPFAHIAPAITTVGVIGGACAIAFAWLVWTRAPFAPHEKALVLFGYFAVFEYAVFARSYSLAMPLFAWAAMEVARTNAHGASGAHGDGAHAASGAQGARSRWGLALGLLANTSIYGLAGAGLLALERLFSRRAGSDPDARKRELVQLALFIVLACVALYVMAPDPNVGVVRRGGRAFVASSFVGEILIIAHAWALPIPPIAPHWWKDLAHVPWPAVVLAFATLLISVRAARLHPVLVLVLLSFCTLFGYFVYGVFLRHIGNLWFFVIALWWIARADPTSAARLTRVDRAALALLAGAHVIAACLALPQHHAAPLSRARDVAAWIDAHDLSRAPVVAEDDRASVAISAYLDAKPIITMARFEPTTYIVWDTERTPPDDTFVSRNVTQLHADFRDAVLLLAADRGPQIQQGDARLVRVASFGGAIAEHEVAWVYVFADGAHAALAREEVR